jgi:hypothetical protein
MALVMTSSRWLTTGAGSFSGTTHGVRLNLVNAGGLGTSWAASWISLSPRYVSTSMAKPWAPAQTSLPTIMSSSQPGESSWPKSLLVLE